MTGLVKVGFWPTLMHELDTYAVLGFMIDIYGE